MAATKYSHPFLRGLKPVPEGYESELQEIREWMKTQPHLPYISDEYLYLFMHSNFFKVKETKDTIESYFTLRANTPDLFTNRDPLLPKNKTILDITHMVALPKPTAENYNLLLYRLADTDYSKLNFADAVRVFCMFNDVKLSEDGLSDGYVVIFDMKGCSLGHLTRLTLPALRAFMHYIQNAHPCRLRKIHVVNTVSFINQVMCIVKPLIYSNLINLLNFSSEGPASVVDLELLPEDYGGPQPSVKQLHEEQRRNMENNYREWLTESEMFKVDEKKRVKKPSKGMFASFTSSFKSLDID
ncbi:alpha-tocopherol transfer protein-like [Aricia agestis]|uniref:alpha-tocopherol transfer protein-like n=1 Tax=Aricia agestis TaxID=91739 RepID=UPI001C20833D|nr:alpha-tocopherol transfer protein-like [Aricia agestis]